jgi:lantibiotic modifying enzyme
MGLATLHELTGDRWVLERAETCAAHLLSTRRTEPTTGRRIWEIEGAGYKSGFAHGAGGIAAALLRLGRATGNEEYLAAASEAYDFEGEFAAAHRVATSCGDRGAPVGKGAFRWEYTWCNGYVGVALGRAAHGGGLDAEVLEGLDTTVDSMPDHVCCGHMGRAELLLLSGRRDQALALTAAILERAARESSYTIARDVPDARVTPAFFQGASGIGYQLLRLAEPQRVPSVLALR